MRIIKVDELKDAVFKLAKERGMLPYGVERKQFYANTTKYVKLPEYCRLVTAALRQKGVNMDIMRAKLMLVCNLSKEKYNNGKIQMDQE